MKIFFEGCSIERKEPSFEELKTKAEFQTYAEKLGEQFATRHSDTHYLLFSNHLIDHLTKPSEHDIFLKIILA